MIIFPLIFRLYKSRLFSDICIITYHGTVHFHRAILASRCPTVNNLIQQLLNLQNDTGLNKLSTRPKRLHKLITLHLPDASYAIIKQFIDILYTGDDICCLKNIKKIIKERIEWLVQLTELKRHKVPIQPLERSVSQQIQKDIWDQLKGVGFDSRQSTPTLLRKKFDDYRCSSIPTLSKSYHGERWSLSSSCSQYDSHQNLRTFASSPQKVFSDKLEYPSQSLEVIDLSSYLQNYSQSVKPRVRSGTFTVRKGRRSHLPILCSRANSSHKTESPISFTELFLSSKAQKNYQPESPGTFSNNEVAPFYLNSKMKMENESNEVNNSQMSCSRGEVHNSPLPAVESNVEPLKDTTAPSESPRHDAENKTCTLLNNTVCDLSNSPERQDNDEREYVESIPNSSSMEVELASSVGSCGSDKRNSPAIHPTESCEDYSLKPLVRTRTFEIIERNPHSTFKSAANATPESSFSSAIGAEASNPSTVVLRKHRQRAVGQSREEQPLPEVYPQQLMNSEQCKEMERMKGSLVFENNFQTFSNIPQTNLMSSTNVVSNSLSSDSSIGISSLFSSMQNSSLLSSIHSVSVGGEPLSRPPSVALSNLSYTEELSLDGDQSQQMAPQLMKRGFVARNVPSERLRNDMSSKSPSPDSLNMDQSKNARRSYNDPDSLMSGKSDNTLRYSVDSTASGNNKEDLDDEVKEQDDSELHTMPENILLDSVKRTEPDRENQIRSPLKQPLQLSSENSSSNSSSPKVPRKTEQAPILSGGSTLRRQSTSDKSEVPFDRQISTSSVKDIDSIPLICGFVNNLDEKSEQEGRTESAEEKQPQSIFSMFIDLKELPSPNKEKCKKVVEKPPIKEKTKSQAVYMYIDANEGVSPKERSRLPSKSEKAKTNNDGKTDSVVKTRKDVRSEVARCKSMNEATEKSSEDASDKKGFFVFIEADANSNSNSPKVVRKPPILSSCKKSKDRGSCSTVMSRSAPSDVLLFETTKKADSSGKLCSRPLLDGEEMTKSVIDRKEFMEQPIAKRNVSLDKKINETPASPRFSKDNFVSGIPRPIHLIKSKSCSKVPGRVDSYRKLESGRKINAVDHKPPSGSTLSKDTKPRGEGTKHERYSSMKKGIDDLTSSLTASFSEAASSMSLPLDSSISSDASSLLGLIERRNPSSGATYAERSSRLGEDLLPDV